MSVPRLFWRGHVTAAFCLWPGFPLDMLRCESLLGLDQATCSRVLNKNYKLLVSMAPLSNEIRPISSCTPQVRFWGRGACDGTSTGMSAFPYVCYGCMFELTACAALLGYSHCCAPRVICDGVCGCFRGAQPAVAFNNKTRRRERRAMSHCSGWPQSNFQALLREMDSSSSSCLIYPCCTKAYSYHLF